MRIGNAASAQLQLDVYGEVIDALYQARVAGAPADEQTRGRCARSCSNGSRTAGASPDAGIWEVRGPDAALHALEGDGVGRLRPRACASAEEFGTRRPGRPLARDPRRDPRPRCSSAPGASSKQAFAQSYGSDELDASVLLMPLVGFLPADDPRIVATVAAIERSSCATGFVLRYVPRTTAPSTGSPATRACSCRARSGWPSVLALQGRHDDAERLFERLLGLRNDVGLLAEEYDPVAGRLLGNFPQAFTHLELINTALVLDRVGASGIASPGP